MKMQTWFRRAFIPLQVPSRLRAPADVPSEEVPRQRSILILGTLILATIGIYALVWFAKSWDEISREHQSSRPHPWVHAFLIIVPLAAGTYLFFVPPFGWWHLIAVALISIALTRLYRHFQSMARLFEVVPGPRPIRPAVPVGMIGVAALIYPVFAWLISWMQQIDPHGVTDGTALLALHANLLIPCVLAIVSVYGQRALNTYLDERYGAGATQKTGTLMVLAAIPSAFIVAYLAFAMVLATLQMASQSSRAQTFLEWMLFGYDHPTTGIVLTETDVWSVDTEGDRVLRFERATGEQIGAIGVGDRPYGLAIAESDLWVTNRSDDTIFRIDLETMTVVDTIRLHSRPSTLVYGEGSLWVALSGSSEVVRLDPVTQEITATIDVGGRPAGIAVENGVAWVTNSQTWTLKKVDTRTNVVISETDVNCHPIDVAFGHDSVWVSMAEGCGVVRLDPETLEVQATIPTRPSPWVVIPAEEGIWVAHRSKTISRIDPGINRVVAIQPTDDHLTGMAMGDDDLWVQYHNDGQVARFEKAAVEDIGSTFTVKPTSGEIVGDGDDVWGTSINEELLAFDNDFPGGKLWVSKLDVAAVARPGAKWIASI